MNFKKAHSSFCLGSFRQWWNQYQILIWDIPTDLKLPPALYVLSDLCPHSARYPSTSHLLSRNDQQQTPCSLQCFVPWQMLVLHLCVVCIGTCLYMHMYVGDMFLCKKRLAPWCPVILNLIFYYMCVYVCMCVHACVPTCVTAHMWRLEGNF